jgi:hypothetical protein
VIKKEGTDIAPVAGKQTIKETVMLFEDILEDLQAGTYFFCTYSNPVLSLKLHKT